MEKSNTQSKSKNTNKQDCVYDKLELQWQSEDSEAWGVKDTPFTLTRDENGWNALMGKYRMNEKPLTTEEEAYNEVKEPTWTNILKVIAIMQLSKEEIKNNKK